MLLPLPLPAMAAGSCLRCHPAHYVAVGACAVCHRGDARTERRELAHFDLIGGRFAWFALPDSPVPAGGRQLLARAGCRRCHRSGGKGGRLASDLDRLLPGARPEELVRALRQPALFMPDFAFGEATAVLLVNALLGHSATAEAPAGETPQVVHFSRRRQEEHVFERHCGGCHRLLTRQWGGLGRGTIGPNLSGLFGEDYPATFRAAERWSPEALRSWLRRPRAIRPTTRMAPPQVSEEEVRQLLEVFRDGEGERR